MCDAAVGRSMVVVQPLPRGPNGRFASGINETSPPTQFCIEQTGHAMNKSERAIHEAQQRH
jgi:hypothetical protein